LSSLVVAILASSLVVTAAGGFIALRLSRRMHWVTAFTSGVLIAVAVVTLLPEAFVLEHERVGMSDTHRALLQVAGIGFLLFYLLDLAVPEHHEAGHEHHRHAPKEPRVVGLLGAMLLFVHRLIDGSVIMAASAAGDGTVKAVGLAVLFHNFADGLSTVSVLMRDGQSRTRTVAFIVVVSLAPVLGALVTMAAPMPPAFMAYALASVAGAFLYIGGSHLFVRDHDSVGLFAPLVAAVGFALVVLLPH
jgi:zinc transporter ZupT